MGLPSMEDSVERPMQISIHLNTTPSIIMVDTIIQSNSNMYLIMNIHSNRHQLTTTQLI